MAPSSSPLSAQLHGSHDTMPEAQRTRVANHLRAVADSVALVRVAVWGAFECGASVFINKYVIVHRTHKHIVTATTDGCAAGVSLHPKRAQLHTQCAHFTPATKRLGGSHQLQPIKADARVLPAKQ